MELSFSTAMNGLFTANLRQSVLANNLSNLTTDGFKAQLVDQETLAGPGTRVQSLRRDFTTGSPKETGIASHIYVSGEGFFQVARDAEPAYTRAGNFHVDRDGNLVTPSGFLVEPNIVVPEDSVGLRVVADGRVLSIDPDGNAEELGQLELVRFVNPAGLESLGDNLYAESGNSGDPLTGIPGENGFGTLLQAHVETSNVDPAEQITDQIITQRYYQLNLRVFQTSDALVGRALDLFS